MDLAVDRLILLGDRNKAEVLAVHDNGRWQSTAKKKPEILPLIDALPQGASRLWWGRIDGKGVRPVRPAVQIIRFVNAKQWSQIFFSGRGVIRGKPGQAVLVINDTKVDRWFGVVTLETRPSEMDPIITDTSTQELEPWLGEPIRIIAGTELLPPDWLPDEAGSGLRLDSPDQINGLICQLLHPAVVKKVEEIGEWVPALRTRLDLEHAAGHSFKKDFVDALLRYPAFQERFEAEQERIQREAIARLEETRSERDRLQAEISELKVRKLREIGSAVEELVDDDRVLALATVLGREKPKTVLDLAGIENAILDLSARTVPLTFDTEPIVQAILSRSATDLSPLVDAISRLGQAIQQGNTTQQGNATAESRSLPGSESRPETGREIIGSVEFADMGLSDAQNALLTIAHSGLLPVACGGFAAECVHYLLRGVVAGRGVWWHCPAEASAATDVLSNARVSNAIRQARNQSDKLFAIVLEGIDRAPTESYLEPLLIMRALDLPLIEDSHPWPDNLLLFATITCGGQTVLPVSPGVWRRAIPIVAEPRRLREASEAKRAFWGGTSATRASIVLDGLLPSGVKPLNLDRLERSAYHLLGQAPEALAKGTALASCLARADGTKPVGDFSLFGSLVR